MNKIERKICEKIFPGKDAFDGWVPVGQAPPKNWKPYCYEFPKCEQPKGGDIDNACYECPFHKPQITQINDKEGKE